MKKSLRRKFGIYSALGVAGGMTFGTTAAEADIIFTDFTGSATSGNPLSIDMDGDAVTDFVFDLAVAGPNVYSSFSNWARMRGLNGNAFANTAPGPYAGGQAYGPNNLAFGATISGQSFYGGANGGPLQLAYTSYATQNIYGAFGGLNFPTPATGFVGVQFESGGGDQVFGWIRVTVEGDVTNAGFADAAITVNGFAYATQGTEILAGQVPEPSSVGLLALGAAGLAFRRKKKGIA
jgi:hypothetical protein